jgi:hypothetical protein
MCITGEDHVWFDVPLNKYRLAAALPRFFSLVFRATNLATANYCIERNSAVALDI